VKSELQSLLFRSELTFKNLLEIKSIKDSIADDLKNETDLVIAIGGDGTINSIFPHLLGTGIIFLPLPYGTANDLASSLGFKRNLKQATSSIRNDLKKEIYAIQVNDKFFITTGGIGLGSGTLENIQAARQKSKIFTKAMKLIGDSIYSLFAGFQIISSSPNFLSLEVESECGFNKKLNASALIVSNQELLGGKLLISPGANHSENSINLTIFSYPKKRLLLKAILRMLRGLKAKENDTSLTRLKSKAVKINVLSPASTSFFGDGEIILSKEKQYQLKIVEKKLKVLYYDTNEMNRDKTYEVYLK